MPFAVNVNLNLSNAPSLLPLSPLPQKKEILHNHCLRFFFGRMQYPGEIKNHYYAKFSFFGGGVNQVLYGLGENGDSTHERETFR